MTALADLYAAPPALSAQAPVLLVVGPLVAACAAILAPGPRASWVIAVGGACFTAWMALAVAGRVAREGVVRYLIGGIPPPLGIEFHLDALGALMAMLISFISLGVTLYAGHALGAEVRPHQQPMMQAGQLLCQAGLLGLVSAGDAFNAFVFLELASLGGCCLVAMGGGVDRRALPAAFNYLVFGSIGATFYVIGVGFLYAATGALNFVEMSVRLAAVKDTLPVKAGFAFIVAGLGVKAAIFPLHGWLPGAYGHAPSPVSAFLAATATQASACLLLRYLLAIFPPGAGFAETVVGAVLAPLAAGAVLICSAQAIFSNELRRGLAFSAVAHAGFVMFGFSVMSVAGASSALVGLIAHALQMSAMLMAIGGLSMGRRTIFLSDLAGAARDAPWSAAALGACTAGLAGVPLTMGFVAKWQLIQAALEAGLLWMAAVIVLGSLLTLIYVARMLEALFFRSPEPGTLRAREAPVGVLVPVWIFSGLGVWFGIDGSIPGTLAASAAQSLLGALR